MTQTMNIHDAEVPGQTRVWSVNVRFGDYIRIDGHNVADSTRNQWIRVVKNDNVELIAVTAGKITHVWTHDTLRAGGGYKLYLHPYSLKHNR